ncbi:MAG: SIR2 family NAD-dependent protein deacylase [Atopobiaceae bacterium]
MTESIGSFSDKTERIAEAIRGADAVFVGAGAGLSVAAGFSYDGERFESSFADFKARFGIEDMYTGGFYPFLDKETYWAWWSRMIWVNRYACPVGKAYQDLVALLEGCDYFVLTTNVDHQFQRAGIDKARLFYTQGDYGLFQCSVPCRQVTYDNRDMVEAMVREQKHQRIPSDLLPRCPRCGEPLVPNLRSDDRFVEDRGWHEAARRYEKFLKKHRKGRTVLLEIGVGGNTPSIIKFPFWRMAQENRDATYVQLNFGEVIAPRALEKQAILVDGDAAKMLAALREKLA